MTVALKKVFEKLNTLPASEQNAIASLLNEELRWKKSFDASQNQLSNLAAEALVEYKKGKTKPMDLK